MREVVRVKMENSICTVTQNVEIVTCQCQYLVTDKRTGEQSEITLRFIVPDNKEWFDEAERITEGLGYSVDHQVGICYLHKTWINASDLYAEGSETYG